jgi:c-di-GMP-binding flagellar brake protein YcgR
MSTDKAVIEKERIDQSELVGRELKIKSEQFPGKALNSKVVGVSGDNLIIDRSGSGGLVDDLISNQDIMVFVDYKGEPVVFQSKIVSPAKGRLQIPLASKLIPEINREFERITLTTDIRLAYFNNTAISTTRLNKLRWIETNTVNISGGGMLVQIPANLDSDFYMILHLGLLNLDIPRLLVGQVRHSHLNDENKFNIGVEFIIRETFKKTLPRGLIRNLPQDLFSFDNRGRLAIAAFVKDKKKINRIE